MSLPRYEIVVAYDEAMGIGRDGLIPWLFYDDMVWFKWLTKRSVCISGRKTYESILQYTNNMGLQERYTLVLSSQNIEQKKYGQSPFEVVPDIMGACSKAEFLCANGWGRLTPSVYIIGGQSVYEQTLFLADVIWATEVKGKFSCDSFFPKLTGMWSVQIVKERPDFTIKRYERLNKVEYVY